MKNYIQLIENVQKDILLEGQHDKLIKDTLDSIISRYKDTEYEDQVRDIVYKIERKWKTIRTNQSLNNFEKTNAWKQYLAMLLRSVVLSNVVTLTNDSKLKSKIDYPEYKSFEDLDKTLEYVNHLSGVPYPPIRQFNPLEKPFSDLERLEDNFKEISEDTLIPESDTDEILIDYGNYRWIMLDRGECEIEGEAMGHCGNEPTVKSGDRILSYREVVPVDGQTYYRPKLTFIYNSGYLGEMKGRGNDKPAPRYHNAIVDLLKLDMIDGIIGGGYEAEKNFHLSDLSEQHLEVVRKHKGDEFIENEGKSDQIYKGITKKYKNSEIDLKTAVEVFNDTLANEYKIYAGEYELIAHENKPCLPILPEVDLNELVPNVLHDEIFDFDSDIYHDVFTSLPTVIQDAIAAYLIDNHEQDIRDNIEEYEEDITVEDVKYYIDEWGDEDFFLTAKDALHSVLTRTYEEFDEEKRLKNIKENFAYILKNELNIEPEVLKDITNILNRTNFPIKNNDFNEYYRTIYEHLDNETPEEMVMEYVKEGAEEYDPVHNIDEIYFLKNPTYMLEMFSLSPLDLEDYIPKAGVEESQLKNNTMKEFINFIKNIESE